MSASLVLLDVQKSVEKKKEFSNLANKLKPANYPKQIFESLKYILHPQCREKCDNSSN